MIDPQEYITSGKLEEYVLGIGSTDVMQEVECMARVFPEIKEEIAALSIALEQAALSSAVAPRAELKKNILMAIDDLPSSSDDTAHTATLSEVSTPDTSENNTMLKWLIALLALSSLFFGYKNCSQTKALEENINEFKLKSGSADSTIDSLNQLNLSLRSQLDIISNPNGVAIHMAGTKLYPAGLSTIYYDKTKQTVYIQPGNLPLSPAGKQYQLWGIVDGKPVSLGVFNTVANAQVLTMLSVSSTVSTFAVTLEPEGGSINPTMDQMYVAGAVTGL